MAGGERVTVKLDIVADEDDPYAELSAHDAAGEELARVRVGAGFRLSAAQRLGLDRERVQSSSAVSQSRTSSSSWWYSGSMCVHRA